LSKHCNKNRVCSDYNKHRRNTRKKQHVQKVLVVVKAYAVGNPGTVMVHLEDALVALRTVVSPVRLRTQTTLAHPHTSVLFLLERNGLNHWKSVQKFFLSLSAFEDRAGFRLYKPVFEMDWLGGVIHVFD
jgi:hypothetical protein